jgi:hypothetical protein
MRAALEAEDFDKPTGYYLGVLTRADRTKLALYLSDADKFKLMPRSNEQVAIRGLELKEESFPPLDLPAQSNLHYFRLVPSSNQRRWDQIKQDKAMSLVWHNAEFDLTDAKFTLFMTMPAATTWNCLIYTRSFFNTSASSTAWPTPSPRRSANTRGCAPTSKG